MVLPFIADIGTILYKKIHKYMYMVLVRMKSRGNEQFSLIGLGYKNICKYQLVMKVNLDNNPHYCICMAAYKYNTQYNTIQQDTFV